MSVSYRIHPEPTHVNAPDAWALWRTEYDDDWETVDDDVIAHGIPLADILEQVALDQELSKK